MRRQTTGPSGRIHGSTGRRGTVIVASAAALCLGGGLLTGCGSGPGEGYAAVGAAAEGGPERSSPGGGKPSGGVTFAPLDRPGGGTGGGGGDRSGTGPSASSPPGTSGPSGLLNGPGGVRTGTSGGEGGSPGAQESGAGDGTRRRPGSETSRPGGGSEGRPDDHQAPGGSPDGPGSPKPPAPAKPKPDPKPPASKPDPEPPATPAALTLSAPQRAAADKRWCEKVTVEFRNTGGSPARSGTVTFATHIIGALGVDWATITSSQPLPAPIRAGATRSETYTVCVASWRVPLGMHVETRNVTAVWE
ncbi:MULTISPECIES: hypothetical protein [Streptomyces]|uniref:hypothetical protein n=1 Tax=Streptomyces TaxID=1883 RepID=UPI00099786C9|nr:MULTISPECIES: hypothetical protein [Streptomyces]MDP9950761.1 hypothetical protein [Streptomyces sp. DSM 41269]